MRSSNIERFLVEVVARVAPWVAPLPTAWLIFDRTQTHLRWPTWVAAAAAVTLECLGLATAVTALELHKYNVSKLKSEPRAPMRLPVALVALYFASALGLTVLLDIVRGLALFAPGLFPVLSLAAMTLLAVRANHAARVEENAEAARARRDARKARATVEARPGPDADEEKPRATIADWRGIVVQMNGDLRGVDAAGVEAILIERGLAPPALRTMQDWARKTKREAGSDR